MSIFKKIKNWFKRSKPYPQQSTKKIVLLDEYGNEEQDEFMRAVIQRCVSTGKVVSGQRNDDGSFEIKEH